MQMKESLGKQQQQIKQQSVSRLHQQQQQYHHLHKQGETTTKDIAMPFVRLFSVFETRTGFVLELELMESNDLFDALSAQGPLTETQVRHIVAQLCDAVAFCQKIGIAHRDIKLSNITFPKRGTPSVSSSSTVGDTPVSATTGTQTSTETRDNHRLPPAQSTHPIL